MEKNEEKNMGKGSFKISNIDDMIKKDFFEAFSKDNKKDVKGNAIINFENFVLEKISKWNDKVLRAKAYVLDIKASKVVEARKCVRLSQYHKRSLSIYEL
jgi:hypothetical protein